MVLQVHYSLLPCILSPSSTEGVRVEVVAATVRIIISLSVGEWDTTKRL